MSHYPTEYTKFKFKIQIQNSNTPELVQNWATFWNKELIHCMISPLTIALCEFISRNTKIY